MARWYFDDDGDLAVLDGRTIGIFGYGNQGRSQALNMRDSGATIIVGSRSDASAEQSRKDGFETLPLNDAAARSDILFILVPDETMPKIFAEHIEPGLEAGNTLVFASGYNIYYEKIIPAAEIDVLMIAPRMIGKGVRDTFVDGTGFPSLVATHRDATGSAHATLIALSKAIGSTKMGVIESSFEEETIVDLFHEHLGALHGIRRGYEVLVESGCSSEAAMLELYASGELREAGQYMMEYGLFDQLKLHSRTSQYGQYVHARPSPEAEEADKDRLRGVVAGIKDGSFAKVWTEVQENDSAELEQARIAMEQSPIGVKEQELYERLGRRKPKAGS